MPRLPLRRLGAFVGLQGLSAVVPLLVLPAINANVGKEGWVALSLGYGIGSAAAIMCAFAWPMLGPHRVASADAARSADVYYESLVTRAVLWVAASVVAAVVTAFLADGAHVLLAVAMAIAMSSWGLTPSWYFIGKGDAASVARFETVPRIASAALSIPLVAVLREPLVYPALTLLASLLALVSASRRILAAAGRRPVMPGGWQERARRHGALAASALVGAGYTSLVLPVSKLAHPGIAALSDVAAASRLRNMAQMGSAAVTSGLQGWVAQGQAGDDDIRARRRKALGASTAAGVVSALALFLLLPVLGNAVFGNVSTMTWGLSLATALACIPYAAGSSLSFHVLAPAGRTGVIGRSRVAASLVGVPAIFVGADRHGAVGVMLATFLAETCVVVWQAAAARDLLRPPRRATKP